jgi:dTMP kinase
MAARRDHVTRLIEPSLAQGIWVVSDRFADSTAAYQGWGRGLALADLAALHRFALGAFAPDLTLVLDLPVEIGLARAAARGTATDRFERLDPAFHDRLRQGFRQIAAKDATRCVLLDASADQQTVHRAVLDAVEQRLGVRLPAIGETGE